jgi:hypothetical protein
MQLQSLELKKDAWMDDKNEDVLKINTEPKLKKTLKYKFIFYTFLHNTKNF